MECKAEPTFGVLVMDDFVGLPRGERFIGDDLAGKEHVLEVIGVERYGWMCRHWCKIVDDEYTGDFFDAPVVEEEG